MNKLLSRPVIKPLHRKLRLFVVLSVAVILSFASLAYYSVQKASAYESHEFVTRWVNLPAGEFKLKLHGTNTFKINWGDGVEETKINVNGEISHNYASVGTHEIRISTAEAGQKFNGWTLQNNPNAKYLSAVLNWGNIKFTNMLHMFSGAINFNSLPNTAPDTSNVTEMSCMFFGASSFNQSVTLNTAKVTRMNAMFQNATAFNQPINFSDTSKVNNMHSMFAGASAFNQPLNFNTTNLANMTRMFFGASAFNQPLNFDTAKVVSMDSTFANAYAFNQPLNFNTAKVTNMNAMFQNAATFNQPINFSDTSKVENMRLMFQGATNFNQPINFDTRSVTNMMSMFQNAKAFNQTINFSDTSKVANMTSMFAGATIFNQPLNFNTSNVRMMSSMFFGAEAFNQALNFNTAGVTDMSSMFQNAKAFNQSLNFNTSKVSDIKRMFYLAEAFNQDVSNFDFSKVTNQNYLIDFASKSGLSVKNYDKLLTKWHSQFQNSSVAHKARSLGLRYCQAETEHDYLKNTKHWEMNDTKNCAELNVAPADITLSIDQINENNAPNFELANITIVDDPDDVPGDTNTPSLTCATAGADDNSFQIAGNKLIFKPVADFETKNSYALCIRATDSFGKTKEKNFTISVRDLNEAPTISGTPATSVNQGEAYSFTPTASDPDTSAPNNTIIFAIENKPSWANFDATTGALTGTPVNEHVGSYNNITIRVTDGNGLTATLPAFNITVNDVNDAPTIANQTFSIPENTANSTELGQVVASDPDAGQALTYEITSGNDLNIFEITNDGKLKVKDNTNLDYEQHQSITLRVKVTDNGIPVLSAEANITINITDVNEAPSWTSIDQITINEDETSEHSLTANDPENNPLTYSADNLPSWITLTNNKLTFNPTQTEVGEHNLTLKVSDGLNETTQTLKVTVKNVNDAPVWISTNTITMNEKETLVHTLTATDEDADSLTYTADNLPSWITLADNKLTLKPQKTEIGNHSITLKVSDGTVTVPQTLTITVNNVNDAPVITSTPNETATKGEQYSYTITATDEDNDPLTYSVTIKPDWLTFDTTTHTLSGTPGNSEAGQTYQITLTVSDGTATTTQTFNLTVNDKNYAPTISDQTFSVAENSANGTELGQVVASDPDAGQTLTYEIVSGNDLNIFEITNDGKLKVKNNTNLDYEQHQSITLKVKVIDNGTPALNAEANITINITDVNEAPSWTSANTITLKHNESKILNLSATDPENNALTYSADGLPAWINLTGDKLTINPSETEIGDHSITVKVSDGVHITSQTLQIKVLLGNVAPVIADQTFSVAENSANGTEIGQLMATDINAEDILSYEILSGNDLNIFEIINDGKLKVRNNAQLDYEQVQQIVLVVKVKDNGTPQLSAQAQATIDITDVDDEAPSLTLDNSPITLIQGQTFVAPTATCHDNQGSCNITVNDPVDTNVPGDYQVVYTATDLAGNQTVAHLQVRIVAKSVAPASQQSQPTTSSSDKPQDSPEQSQNNRPPFVIRGGTEISLTVGDTYHELGVECVSASNCAVETTGRVDTSKPGAYTISYKLVGGDYKLSRRVIVREPVIAKPTEKPKSWWQIVLDFIIKFWWIWLILLILIWWFILFWKRRKREE